MKRSFALLLILVLALPFVVHAQTPTTPPNPNANVSWPPPVYVVRGQFPIRGTANLPNMTTYFLEFRPINDDLSPQVGADVWFPAILPSQAAVQDGVLGTWDTTLIADGLYQLRLTVNVSQGNPVFAIVSPLRIQNTPSPFEVTPTPIATFTPIPPPATAVPTQDATPRVTINPPGSPTGNVRQGDSTFYGIITSVPAGTIARVLGISNRGTGWYQIQLDNGQIGWVAPSIATPSGDLSGLPRIQPPPPPPPTATPIPTAIPATAVPVSQANLFVGNVNFDPGSPQCNQPFQVKIDIANLGSHPTAFSGTVTVTDTRAADGTQQGPAGSNSFPIIQPGQTINVSVVMTIGTYYNEQHNVTVNVDPSNQIPETTKGDNVKSLSYTLNRASCP